MIFQVHMIDHGYYNKLLDPVFMRLKHSTYDQRVGFEISWRMHRSEVSIPPYLLFYVTRPDMIYDNTWDCHDIRVPDKHQYWLLSLYSNEWWED